MNKEQTIEGQIKYLTQYLCAQVAEERDLECVSFPYKHCYYKTDSTEDGSVRDVLSVDDFTWEPAHHISNIRREIEYGSVIITEERSSRSGGVYDSIVDLLDDELYDQGTDVIYDFSRGFVPTLNDQGKSKVLAFLNENFKEGNDISRYADLPNIHLFA